MPGDVRLHVVRVLDLVVGAPVLVAVLGTPLWQRHDRLRAVASRIVPAATGWLAAGTLMSAALAVLGQESWSSGAYTVSYGPRFFFPRLLLSFDSSISLSGSTVATIQTSESS